MRQQRFLNVGQPILAAAGFQPAFSKVLPKPWPALLLFAALPCFAQTNPATKPTLVYVGTHTGGSSQGIYVYRLQTTGLEVSQNITLVPMGLAAETPNPSALEIDEKRRLIFAVNESDSGSVSAFSVQPNGTLALARL